MKCEKVLKEVKIQLANGLKTTDAFIWVASKGSCLFFYVLEMIFENQP